MVFRKLEPMSISCFQDVQGSQDVPAEFWVNLLQHCSTRPGISDYDYISYRHEISRRSAFSWRVLILMILMILMLDLCLCPALGSRISRISWPASYSQETPPQDNLCETFQNYLLELPVKNCKKLKLKNIKTETQR
jgi:hypothetical protein